MVCHTPNILSDGYLNKQDIKQVHRQKYACSRDMCVCVCVDSSCLLIKDAVLKSDRSPRLTRPRAHPARTCDLGKRRTAEPGHPDAAPRANLIRQITGLDWGKSMKEVIHQPPDYTWRV